MDSKLEVESTLGMRTLILAGMILAMCGDRTARGENRTYDGTGNNLAHPTWGAAGTDLLRKSTISGYADGISAPRGISAATLPNPRVVSNSVVKQATMTPNAHKMTDWVFQWGQFIDHDLDLTDLATPTESLNIPIPAGDPVFDAANTGTAIMSFQRSKHNPLTGTSTDNPRQQVNELTSYIDASQVYGSSAPRALALRTMSDGLMKTSAGNLLPLNALGLPNGTGGPVPPAVAEMFYLAGDVRANEQVGLTAAHTLFVREHNRLAAEVAPQFAGIADPVARDEAIYQKARKLVGGEIQAITYNEFLPALLGDFAPKLEEASYDATVNASVSTEFSTALFRVGHTMLSPQLMRMDNDGNEALGGHMSLRDSFFRPGNLAGDHELEYFLKGLASEQQQEVDMHIVDDVRDFLFGEPIAGGFDLATLNIQRGRDHGLPGYNDVREAFGLPRKATFADMTTDPQVQAALQLLYTSPDVVDAWVGGLSEDHLAGAALGELVVHGLVDQFTRARDGDRFWFTRDDGLTSDEKDWLNSLRLSDVILANTDYLTHLQDNVFFMAVPEPSAAALTTWTLTTSLLWRRRSA